MKRTGKEREAHNLAMKKYYATHRDKIRAANRECAQRLGHTWKSSTKEYRREVDRRSKERLREDPIRVVKRRTWWNNKSLRYQKARLDLILSGWKGWRGDPLSSNAELRKRQTVFSHYGGMCACCGEDNYAFLTLDHINDDGGKRRKSGEHKGSVLHAKLIKLGFPSDFQLLCWNCNITKHTFGECPHQLVTKHQLRLVG